MYDRPHTVQKNIILSLSSEKDVGDLANRKRVGFCEQAIEEGVWDEESAQNEA